MSIGLLEESLVYRIVYCTVCRVRVGEHFYRYPGERCPVPLCVPHGGPEILVPKAECDRNGKPLARWLVLARRFKTCHASPKDRLVIHY